MTAVAPAGVPSVLGTPRRWRGRYVFAVGACIAAVVAVVVLAVVLSNNVVYFRTVSEAVRNRGSEGTARFRLAGVVVSSSIEKTREGVQFRVTDGNATVTVDHRGDAPALFKDGAPVVVEGRWARGRRVVFDSDRILIKHGAEYSPPKVSSGKAGSEEPSLAR